MAENKTDEFDIKVYALSTCAWCNKIKKFFAEHEIEYDGVDVDLLAGEEKEAVRATVREVNPRLSYPTIVIGEEVIVGYDIERLTEVLGL